MSITVSGLFVYPIKSCRGISVPRANMSLRGLTYDREWMVADADGKFLSQRTHPKMCLIEPTLTPEWLVVCAPNMPLLRVPLDNEPGPIVDARVHKDACKGIDQGFWVSAWFTAFLGTPCRLLRAASESVHVRSSKAGVGAIGFADAHEVLLISEASLIDLNARLETPVPMDRFRPNIVVKDCDPYAEDDWGAINVASVRLIGADACVRCVMTTTDQASGERGTEPLKTLASYRKTPKGVVFGRNFNGGNGGQIDLGSLVDLSPRF